MDPQPYRRGFDDDLSMLSAKLAETSLLLEVLAYVNSLMSKNLSFEDFCVEVGKILQEKLKFTYLHIWIRDEQKPDTLKLLTPEREHDLRTADIRRGIIGRCIREAQTVCVPDVNMNPDYLRIHTETKSELCVPLLHDGQAIGAINIETDTYQNFQTHLPIIQLIADNLSHSLRHALLFNTAEQFHKLVEHMTEGVWIGDEQERTIYVNPAYEKMTGYSKEEMERLTSYDVFDEKSCETIKRESEKRKYGMSSHYEAAYVSKNGGRIPVIIHAAPWGNGSMAVITDLRQMKAIEGKLAKSELFLASITQNCAEAIVGFNEHGEIQTWNVGAERMFGYKEQEIIGKTTDVIVPEDRREKGEFTQLLQEVKIKSVVKNFETVRLHKNQKPINISLTLNAIRDVNGNLIGISGLYRDITAQKKWERELQDRFEKMQDAYREMGKQRRYLDYLIDMIHLADSTTLTKKQISTFIVNAMVMITRVDGASLRLFDHESNRLVLLAQSGLGEDWWSKKTIPYGGSLLEKAVQQGSPLKILDVLSDPRYPSPALARKNNLRSALIIPLQAKGEVLGSLVLYLSQDGNLSLLDDEFIGMFAKQSSIALKLAA